ncbi:MAG: serine hydrolase, partial [Bacteroidota bacterium]
MDLHPTDWFSQSGVMQLAELRFLYIGREYTRDRTHPFMKTQLGLLSLALSLGYGCNAQPKTSPLSAIVDGEARQFLEDDRFHAVSVAVYYQGETYIGHYGELVINQKNTPTNETLYELASVTKTMTGYLTACAVEEGLLTLNTPVYEVLGNRYRNLAYQGEPVRIQHLVTHTSGIPLNISTVSELYESPSIGNYRKAQQILSSYTKEELLEEVQALTL